MRMRRFSFLAAGLLAALASLLAASTSTAADSGVRVWLTTGDKTSLLSEQPASGPRRAGRRGADDHRRPLAGVPADRRLRGLDHRLLGPPAGDLAAPRRDHADAVRPEEGPRAELPAPADGRLRLHRRPGLHLRRPAARPDRLRHGALLDRPRRGRDPAPAAPGEVPQQGPEGDGHAVEPARLDEDQRLARRRPADRRPAGLRRPGQVLRGLRPGVRGRGRPDRRADHPERAPEPQPERLSGHGPARSRGGPDHRAARAGAAPGAGCT